MKIENLNKRYTPIKRLPVRRLFTHIYELQAIKLLGFVLVLLTFPFGGTDLKCQNVLLDKQIIGGGGMVELVNGSGMKISGLVTQTAIDQISLSTRTDYLHIYQGFWVPNPLLNPVSDSSDVMNEFLNVYPNPISSSASIYYYLSNKSLVSIKLYDILGELVAEIYYGIQEPGSKLFVWEVTDVPNGSYLISIELKSLATNVIYSSSSSKYNKKVVILK